jgi:polyhydroxyalkanoate synthesis regulator phasin
MGDLRWSFVNAKRRLQAAEDRAAELEARIERLEGQVRDLGAEPVP